MVAFHGPFWHSDFVGSILIRHSALDRIAPSSFVIGPSPSCTEAINSGSRTATHQETLAIPSPEFRVVHPRLTGLFAARQGGGLRFNFTFASVPQWPRPKLPSAKLVRIHRERTAQLT